MAARAIDSRNRAQTRHLEKCRGWQGASPDADTAAIALEVAADPACGGKGGADLFLAARPSWAKRLPLLRQAGGAGQAVLPRTRGHGLYSAQGTQGSGGLTREGRSCFCKIGPRFGLECGAISHHTHASSYCFDNLPRRPQGRPTKTMRLTLSASCDVARRVFISPRRASHGYWYG